MTKSMEILGWPFHTIDENGVINSLPRTITLGNGIKRNYAKGREIPIHICSNGYPSFSIRYNNKVRLMAVHRVLALLFIENPNNMPQVNHIDGNKLNYSLSNLEWVSRIGNVRHFHENLQCPIKRGRDSVSVKLKMDNVDEILRLIFKSELSYAKIAKIYGVTSSTICDIAKGKTWHNKKFSILEIERYAKDNNITTVSSLIESFRHVYGDIRKINDPRLPK